MRTTKTDQTGWMPRLICLCWAYRSFCWFCHAAAQICVCLQEYSSLSEEIWDKSSNRGGNNVQSSFLFSPLFAFGFYLLSNNKHEVPVGLFERLGHNKAMSEIQSETTNPQFR